MQRPYLLLIILIASQLMVGCTQKNDTAAQLLDPAAFARKLNETPDKIVLDVRTPAEYRDGHLPEATLIDIEQEDFRQRVQQLDRSKPLFVYCASGIRSERAVEILRDIGHREIYELDGGFADWVQAGKAYEKGMN